MTHPKTLRRRRNPGRAQTPAAHHRPRSVGGDKRDPRRGRSRGRGGSTRAISPATFEVRIFLRADCRGDRGGRRRAGDRGRHARGLARGSGCANRARRASGQFRRHRCPRRARRQRRVQSRQAHGLRAGSGGGGADRGAGEIAGVLARRTRRDAPASRRSWRPAFVSVKSAPRETAAPVDLSGLTTASPRSSGPIAPRRPRSRRRTPSPPMTCRCAASWRRPCSTFSCGAAIPTPRRFQRRNRWRRIRTP